MSQPATIFNKYEKVKHLIRPLAKVAVAYSGGVDSSLLLYASIEALGYSNVVAIHGRSCLNISEEGVDEIHQRNFIQHKKLVIIDLKPLGWPDFIENDKKRCYYCKKKTYQSFRDYLAEQGDIILLDGTNTDDLLEERAGLVVLKEMKVRTPLADAGLNKKDVRFLARKFNLSNYNSPSNSCLATRLSFLSTIDSNKLKIVERIEDQLKKMGFFGCRVKPYQDMIIIEVRQQDYVKISQRHNRIAIIGVCNTLGFNRVLLDLKGRHQ